MKTKAYTYPSASALATIHAWQWYPEDGNVKAVLLLHHGMAEHCGRYGDFLQAFADMGYAVAINAKFGLSRINNIYLGSGWYVFKQRRCRIDVQTGAYHYHHIGVRGYLTCYGKIRHILAEEHNIRAQQTAIGVPVAVVLLPALQRDGGSVIDVGAQLGYFAVQVGDIYRPCPLVQVIDILSDNLCARKRLLESRNSIMCGIGLCGKCIATACVIKIHT